MKHAIIVFLAIILCTVSAHADKVPAPIPIGIGVAQTSNVALFGEEEVNGARIAEKLLNAQGGVNGTPVRLVYQDTGGDEAGAVNAFQNLINRDKVVGIIGPTLSQQAFSADPVANRAKVPVLASSNTAKGIPQIGDYIGRVSAPIAAVAPHAVQEALKLNPRIKRVAVLYAQNDAYSTSETGTFQESVKKLGLMIATVQKFQTTDSDFTTQVTAVLAAKVDLAVISGLAADSGNLVKQLRQLGYKGLIVGGQQEGCPAGARRGAGEAEPGDPDRLLPDSTRRDRSFQGRRDQPEELLRLADQDEPGREERHVRIFEIRIHVHEGHEVSRRKT